MKSYQKLVLTVLLILTAYSANAATVLIEAESFADKGGWVVDQQFMDQMGSSMLLAHGMGVAVADAGTTVKVPAVGKYHIYVRTRNWVDGFDGKDAPGRFQLLVNGKALDTTFGDSGYQWHWQYGGNIQIDTAETTLTLHDLTGFAGRCDAIILTTNKDLDLPNSGQELTAFRKKLLNLSTPKDAGQFDLVVVGGGMAGSSAAVSAARLGLSVALIQNRPLLGGNHSSEVRVHLGGDRNRPPYPNLGNLVNEIASSKRGNAQPAENYQDEKKLKVVRGEKNVKLFLNTHVFKVEKQNDRITAVIGKNIETSKELRFAAPLFADCTGDGTIGYLAGADWRMGREGKDETGESLAPAKADKMTMGTSVQWYSVKADSPSAFPDCPWAVQFNEQSCQKVTHGEWDWETGMNRDQIADFEYIRDYALRVNYGNWAFLKNKHVNKAKYANRKLGWVAYVGGKRESRRLLGDLILKEQHITDEITYDDSFVTATWTIDLHYPQPANTKHFPGAEFRSIAKHVRNSPYAIPYRCFYSRNVDNLFMAGRNISVTHVALGTVRVMGTTGMMGELVGMAASICKEKSCSPRQVYTDHLKKLKKLATKGVGKK